MKIVFLALYCQKATIVNNNVINKFTKIYIVVYIVIYKVTYIVTTYVKC